MLASIVVVALSGSSLASPGSDDATDAARGRVFAQLVAADASHCGGHGFYLPDHPEICTHGPDDAPAGVDVRTWRTTEELQAAGTYARAESGAPASQAPATEGTASAPTDGSGAIVCEGDGTTGPRTQVLYVHASDVPSRLGSLADTIGSFMLAMDSRYNASARETGGSRHVRFVTERSTSGTCQLAIGEVVVSPTGDDSFNNTESEVQAAGWDAARIGQPRRFLMLVDAKVLCGIGQVYTDDQPGQDNRNNSTASLYSRADQGCWNQAEAHELMHTLGGVQMSAPHSTGAYHCTDEYDIECYNDGGPRATLRYVCASAHESRFDCNHDDYFHTNPPAGSYLATHWNTANSRFLIDPATTETFSTGPDPCDLRSEQLSGTFNATGRYAVTRQVRPGGTKAAATSSMKVNGATRATPITVRITDSSGATVASGSGTGSVTVTYPAAAEKGLTWALSGTTGTTWSVTLSYYA
jgi:hypothetical protein